jgi:hypothetical protein
MAMAIWSFIGLVLLVVFILKLQATAEKRKKEAAKQAEYLARKEIFFCCGNCENFEDGKPETTNQNGFCPNIYWTYDINRTHSKCFCRDFTIAKRFNNKYRVDMKSRPAEKGFIAQIQKAGLKKQDINSMG